MRSLQPVSEGRARRLSTSFVLGCTGWSNKVLQRPEVQQAWAKQGAVPMIMTPAEFDSYLRKDIDKWAEVVRVSGAKVQ